MKRTVIGILAHVDAGKTTAIESMLYLSGAIRSAGRVDHGNTVLDYDGQERDHGITIYSKETHFTRKDTEIYVIDTPGHVDFSAEMERVLQVLDIAIVLISGTDGVQSHTETIWKCLEHYDVPCILFVNKMDICRVSEEEHLAALKKLSPAVTAFGREDTAEQLATISEEALEAYLETESVPLEMVQDAFVTRNVFPCLFGSALKMDGMKELMDLIADLTFERVWPEEFGARVYKISVDESGTRLTHMKITGGELKAKQKLSETEKADQLRLYSGSSFVSLEKAEAGMICTVKGLSESSAGQGLGFEENAEVPLLSACLEYRLIVPEGADILLLGRVCRQLAEEDPMLEIESDTIAKTIRVRIMGDMQMEVLQKKIEDRCGIHVTFGTGSILYRETITEPVDGAGHFEPLRHYAEVHVRLEPLARGSGIEVISECPTDELSANWQRSILNALSSRHRGVLTGFPLTDVRIVLTAGKGHLKHTEGQDFRQAARRAVRQALMKGNSVVLEPYAAFTLYVPSASLSRALYDLDTREASVNVEEDGDRMKITGRGPLRTLMNYQKEVLAYTRGAGVFSSRPDGYEISSSQEARIEEVGYRWENDLRNPPGSVFCAHGAGYAVEWYEADELMHVQPYKEKKSTGSAQKTRYHVSEEEMKALIEGSSSNNRNTKKQYVSRRPVRADKPHVSKEAVLPPCLLIDGYNMIYAWEDLKELAREDITHAREKLTDRIFNYQGFTGEKIVLVFDGYKVRDNRGTTVNKGNMSVVYTRTDQTADMYIEELSYKLKGKYRVTVASSDGLIQNAAFAHAALRMSARELVGKIESVEALVQAG